MRLPQSFKNAVTATAKSLNQSYKHIGVTNEGASLHLAERNVLLHVGAHLLHAGFALATEPSAKANAAAPDLLASNQKITFLLTAQSFGKILPHKILRQSQTMERYRPRLFPRLEIAATEAFWQRSEHWAGVFIQSLAGEEFNELWCGQLRTPEAFEKKLLAFSKLGNAGKEDFSELAAFLREHDTHVGMEPICNELWNAGERLDLLWAAFPIE